MLQHVQIHLHMISRAQHTYENGIGRRAPKPGYAAVRPLPGPLSGPFVLKLEHGYHHLPVSALLTAKIMLCSYRFKRLSRAKIFGCPPLHFLPRTKRACVQRICPTSRTKAVRGSNV